MASNRATNFVSHAWYDDFMDTVDAVNAFTRMPGELGLLIGRAGHGYGEVELPNQLGDNGALTMRHVWLDIMCINQFVPITPTDLSDNITAAGSILVTLNKWPAPTTLTRVWCLFEIMTALELEEAGVELLCSLSLGAQRTVRQKYMTEHQDIDAGKVTISFDDGLMAHDLASIDVEAAKASFDDDRRRILAEISRKFGYTAFNARISDAIKPMMSIDDIIYDIWFG